jgi:hypothetical protein
LVTGDLYVPDLVDAIIATAILDRVLHHSVKIATDGTQTPTRDL